MIGCYSLILRSSDNEREVIRLKPMTKCVDLLYHVIQLWPNPGAPQDLDCSKQLEDFLSPRFKRLDLLTQIDSIQEILSVNKEGDNTSITFNDSEGCLHRAVFHKMVDRCWLLKSLEFQCPGCFGEGINNGELCTLCGGKGWGVS